MFLSARAWSPEDTAQAKPFGDHGNIYRVPGFKRMDSEGGVHFAGGRSVPCVDTVRHSPIPVPTPTPLKYSASSPSHVVSSTSSCWFGAARCGLRHILDIAWVEQHLPANLASVVDHYYGNILQQCTSDTTTFHRAMLDAQVLFATGYVYNFPFLQGSDIVTVKDNR